MNTFRNSLVVALAVTTGFLSSCSNPASLVEQQNCKQQLRSLWCAIELYRHDHNKWPATLESLDTEVVGRILFCPGAKRNIGASSQTDYHYVNWSQFLHTTNADFSRFPLIYDRRLINHGGRGINILLVDGSVEWDTSGKWLKVFAADHPNAKLLMPE